MQLIRSKEPFGKPQLPASVCRSVGETADDHGIGIGGRDRHRVARIADRRSVECGGERAAGVAPAQSVDRSPRLRSPVRRADNGPHRNRREALPVIGTKFAHRGSSCSAGGRSEGGQGLAGRVAGLRPAGAFCGYHRSPPQPQPPAARRPLKPALARCMSRKSNHRPASQPAPAPGPPPGGKVALKLRIHALTVALSMEDSADADYQSCLIE
jgi:hypothetical protein